MPVLPEPNPQSEAEQLEAAVDQAIAACGGDPRAAIRALVLANDFLEAARLAFPTGGMTAAKLRRAIDDGKLKGYRVGRTVFTTLKDIRLMLESSVVTPSPKVEWRAGREPPDPLGRSPNEVAMDKLNAMRDKLKKAPNNSR